MYINVTLYLAESERSATLEPLPEGRAEWRPAVLPDSDVVKALETVEGKLSDTIMIHFSFLYCHCSYFKI